MDRPTKLAPNLVDEFVSSQGRKRGHGDGRGADEHSPERWAVVDGGLEKTFTFSYYGAAVAFAVHVGFAAEKRDHHPDLHISFGKVRVRFTTHDAGGITSLDVEMAELCEHAYRR